jgi:hypothetical protein
MRGWETSERKHTQEGERKSRQLIFSLGEAKREYLYTDRTSIS